MVSPQQGRSSTYGRYAPRFFLWKDKKMKDSKVMRKNIKTTVSLQKDDFSAYAVGLGIWDALTNDDNSIEQVEVLVLKRELAVQS
jgi:hypothetical protein